MSKIKDLAGKANWEPFRRLYFELKTFGIFYPERVRRLVETHGPKAMPETKPEPGRIILATTTALEASTLVAVIEKTAEMLAKAKEAQAGLVVFPPNAADVLLQLAPVKTRRVARLILEAYEPFWGSLAQKYRVWIIAGSRTVYNKGQKRVVCYCFEPSGKCRYQAKTHLSPTEQAAGYLPGCNVNVWQTGAGPVTVMCSGEEQYFELGRVQAAKGAKVVIRLGQWEGGLGIKALSGEWARAQENNLYYISGSKIFSPAYLTVDGSGVTSHHTSEGLPFIQVDLNLDRLHQTNEDTGAIPGPNKDIVRSYLPNLYRQLAAD